MEAAIAAARPALAAVEPGRCVGLAVDLPPGPLSPHTLPDGDSHWLAASDGLELCGLGVAARFDAGSRFRDECRRWLWLGQDERGMAPVAFFTAPPDFPATGPGLWVPQVLLRRSGERTSLWLAARRDDPPEAIVRRWRIGAETLLAGGRDRGARPTVLSTRVDPGAEAWGERVRAAAGAIGEGHLDKVVLARRLEARLSGPVDAAVLVRGLSRHYPGCSVFAVPHGAGVIVGASPERVAAVRDGHVLSHALAGTAARGSDEDEDRNAAARLLASAKERHEHAVVVDFIVHRLAEVCCGVDRAAEPTVMRLRRVQHLWTPVRGRLRDGVDLLDVAALLHPTPAVLGQPRQSAGAWLRRVGERRDGLYTGLVGWVDGHGNGDAAVVLRSAHVEGTTAVLWAGAGIMAESDPAAELAETDLKLATMLDVLEGR